jgi:hypothetical protein
MSSRTFTKFDTGNIYQSFSSTSKPIASFFIFPSFLSFFLSLFRTSLNHFNLNVVQLASLLSCSYSKDIHYTLSIKVINIIVIRLLLRKLFFYFSNTTEKMNNISDPSDIA